VKRVGLVARLDHPEAASAIGRLAAWLPQQDRVVVLEKETAGLVPSAPARAVPPPLVVAKPDLPAHSDLIVVLGGDGTLLSMARLVADAGVPLLGVNLGGLGFLTATTLDEMLPALEAVFAGQMVVDDRMLLTARVVRDGERLAEYVALNDVVVAKSPMSRLVSLSVAVEGQVAIAYRADGLIVSTPTGSTAYSLSAGGPILFPTMDAVVLTPICSHSLTNRPIVLPASQRIEITLRTAQDVVLSVDGQVGLALGERDTVEVGQSSARIRLVRLAQRHFFSVLRTKLKWGAR
jgi:NAD+ kinase